MIIICILQKRALLYQPLVYCRLHGPCSCRRWSRTRVHICKSLKEPMNRFPAWRDRFLVSLNVYKFGLSNRFPAWRAGTTTSFDVPVRQAIIISLAWLHPQRNCCRRAVHHGLKLPPPFLYMSSQFLSTLFFSLGTVMPVIYKWQGKKHAEHKKGYKVPYNVKCQ